MFVTSNHLPNERASVEPLPAGIRRFHWLTAALLVPMFALAWSFDWLGPSDVSAALVDLHRSIGILLFFVVLLRLAWRTFSRLEPRPSNLPAWERRLAAAVQTGLYICLFAMPSIGWAASTLSGDSVSVFGLPMPDFVSMNEDWSDRLFQVHEILAWVLLALIALHVAGALRHHFIERDGILNRMRIW